MLKHLTESVNLGNIILGKEWDELSWSLLQIPAGPGRLCILQTAIPTLTRPAMTCIRKCEVLYWVSCSYNHFLLSAGPDWNRGAIRGHNHPQAHTHRDTRGRQFWQQRCVRDNNIRMEAADLPQNQGGIWVWFGFVAFSFWIVLKVERSAKRHSECSQCAVFTPANSAKNEQSVQEIMILNQ